MRKLYHVSNDPEKAGAYYKQRMREVLRNMHISPPERLELLRYYQGKYSKLLLENPDLRGSSCQMEIIFKCAFKERLLEVLRSEHYKLEKGMKIATAPGFDQDFLAYSFDLLLDEVKADKKGGYSCVFSLDDKNCKEHFRGAVFIDPLEADINLQFDRIMPNSTKQEVQVLMGLTYLMRRPEYKNLPYRGGRVTANSNSWHQSYGIDVGKDKIHTVFPFRRRMIAPGDNVLVLVNNLLDSIYDSASADPTQTLSHMWKSSYYDRF